MISDAFAGSSTTMVCVYLIATAKRAIYSEKFLHLAETI